MSSAYHVTSTSINEFNEKHEEEVCESHLKQMSIKDAFGADSTEPEQECFWFPDRLFWCQTWDSFMSFLMIWESAAHNDDGEFDTT